MNKREFNTQVESLYNQVQQEINNLKNLLLGLDLLEEIIEDFDGKVINKRIETKFKEKSKSGKMYLRVNKPSANTTFLNLRDTSCGYSQEGLNVVAEFRDKRLNSKDTLKNLEEVRERTTLKIEGLEEFTLIKIYELQCEGLDLINKVRFYNTSLSKSSSLYDGLFIR